jgi:hypothetical protein
LLPGAFHCTDKRLIKPRRKLLQALSPPKNDSGQSFVVFARPDDTSRRGEKLCISFAVKFNRKERKGITPA